MSVKELLMKYQFRASRRQYFVCCAVVIASLFIPLTGFIFLGANLARHLPYRLSYLKRLVLALIILVVGNALLYEVFVIIDARPYLQVIGLLYGVLGVAIGTRVAPADKLPILDRADVVCMIVAMVTFGALLFPVIHNVSPRETYTQATLHLLSSGEDNASHYALFKYGYVHGTYAYRAGSNSGIISTLVVYPQGSEFAMSWIARSVLGARYVANDGVLIKTYYLLCSLNFALLVLLTLLFATSMYAKMRGRLDAVSGTVIVIGAGALLFASPLLEIMGRGFHSQVFAYTCMTGVLFLLSQEDGGRLRRDKLLLTALLTAGVCMSWWYLLPVLAFPLILYLLDKRTSLKQFIWWPLAFVTMLGIYPVILSLRASIGANAITAEGGVDVIAISTLGLFMLGIMTILLWEKADSWKMRYVVSAVLGWFLFTMMVAIVQLLSTHHLHYYYYKSLYTLIPLATVIIILSSLKVSDLLLAASRGRLRAFAIIGGVALTLLLLFSLKPTYPQVYVHDWYNNPTSPTIFGLMLDAAKSKTYKDIILVGGCNPGETYIYNRWAGAMMLSESYSRSRFENAVLREQSPEVARYVTKNLKPHSADLIVLDQCLSSTVAGAIPQSMPYIHL